MSPKGKMELLVIATLVCILSLFVSPCAAHQTQVLSSLEQVYDLGTSLTNLPRKLRLVEEPIVKRYKIEESKPEANNKEDFSGKIHSQVMVPGKEGTRQKWIEGRDMWQYFTMDYSQIGAVVARDGKSSILIFNQGSLGWCMQHATESLKGPRHSH